MIAVAPMIVAVLLASVFVYPPTRKAVGDWLGSAFDVVWEESAAALKWAGKHAVNAVAFWRPSTPSAVPAPQLAAVPDGSGPAQTGTTTPGTGKTPTGSRSRNHRKAGNRPAAV